MTLVNEHHDAPAEHNGFEHVGLLLMHMRMEWLLLHFPPRLVWALYVCMNGFITIGLLGLLALLTGSPFVFPSLGPTAYLFFFSPLAEVSSPRNTILGHAIGLVCGYASFVLVVASSPPFGMSPGVHGPRLLAAALSLSATGALRHSANPATSWSPRLFRTEFPEPAEARATAERKCPPLK
jgi:CBS domain-containing membrane protein